MLIESYSFYNNTWSDFFRTDLDSKSTLILVFFESTLDISQHLNKLRNEFKSSQIIGCSTSGEILKTSIYDNSIVVTIIKFEKSQLYLYESKVHRKNSGEVGKAMGSYFNQINSSDNNSKDTKLKLKSIILLTEGLDSDGSELVRELNIKINEKHKEVSIVGGLAADGDRFEKTFVVSNNNSYQNYAVAIGIFSNDLNIFYGTGTGWDPFGPKRIVTKSSINKVYEFDYKPALQVYKEYLKEDAKNLPSSGILFPMAISWGNSQNIVRTVLSVDESDQSITFAGSFPTQAAVQLMHSNVTKLIEGAKFAALHSKEKIETEKLSFTLIVSCIGRRMIMGQKTEDELEALSQYLPLNTHISGFYSYGEYSPLNTEKSELHNQTMTLLILQET